MKAQGLQISRQQGPKRLLEGIRQLGAGAKEVVEAGAAASNTKAR
jgi:hypothetical protein